LSDENLCLKLEERASGVTKEERAVAICGATLAFGDIAGNGNFRSLIWLVNP
jgi:hypothetical protein